MRLLSRIQDSKRNKREKKEKDLIRFQVLERENAERVARLERKNPYADEGENIERRSTSRERLDIGPPPGYDEATIASEQGRRRCLAGDGNDIVR